MSLGTNLFLFISWLHFLLLKLAFRLQEESRKLRPTIFSALYPAGKSTYLHVSVPRKSSFFHSLCLDHMSTPEPITVLRGKRMVSLAWGMGHMELGVELSPKPNGREWWRMWFSEGKPGYSSQENGELMEDITSYR